jgi:hypothetical protein
MKVANDPSEEAYLNFLGDQALDWSEQEKAGLSHILANLRPALNTLALPWPENSLLVKTTGKEEGHAAFTRSNAIFLPPNEIVGKPDAMIEFLVAHELFHVFSRQNLGLRPNIYGIIGYKPCGEVASPIALAPRKLTNPDAPRNDYCIRLGVDGRAMWTTPILLSSTERYDAVKGGDFFAYLLLRFLAVQGGDAINPLANATASRDNPVLADPAKVTGLFEQIGQNTGYIIHPEEVMADNFALLVLGKDHLRSPEIVAKLRDVLGKARDQ